METVSFILNVTELHCGYLAKVVILRKGLGLVATLRERQATVVTLLEGLVLVGDIA